MWCILAAVMVAAPPAAAGPLFGSNKTENQYGINITTTALFACAQFTLLRCVEWFLPTRIVYATFNSISAQDTHSRAIALSIRSNVCLRFPKFASASGAALFPLARATHSARRRVCVLAKVSF